MLQRIIEAPDHVRAIRALAPQAFSSLVRQVGVADAGEIVALASTDQIVAAFDEDLFVGTGPGEREVFDAGRFAVWLEVLLEAGADLAARRVAELSEDFVVQALSSIVLVLDHDALLASLSAGGRSARYADKALESCLCEEIDGYLLVSRGEQGFDAALALILALDRERRPLLERILDRAAAIASEYTDDLDALSSVLSSAESLAEDVEAEREARRSRLGFVEPRAARGFLALARMPLQTDIASTPRDAVTRAYFRALGPRPATGPESARAPSLHALDTPAPLLALPAGPGASTDPATPFIEAMRRLHALAPERYRERMEELVYLANVLMAGAAVDERHLRPAEAAEAALCTVALGAELEARARRTRKDPRATDLELLAVLGECSADLLFRRASSALGARAASAGFVSSRTELADELERYGEP
ncbi:MAG: hypothetical protein JXR96_30795 [Deltaproteobacteria bacterium]|nr:hypothetical protein [Deltaproteobacteria bacterium]